MKRFFVLLMAMAAFFASVFAANLPVGNNSDGNAVTSTSQKKVNIRVGPGTGYGIVGQLQPNDIVWVTDVSTVPSGWVKIHTGKAEGYVSADFVKAVNGNDYVEWVKSYEVSGAKTEKKSFSLNMSGFTGVFLKAFVGLLDVQWWILILAFCIAVGCEIGIIMWLKEKYRYFRPNGPLYTVIIIAFVLNLCVLAMYPAIRSGDRSVCTVWLMLAMSVFPLLVHSCWRLEQNGKVENRYYRNNTSCGKVGKYLGIFAWLIMGFPIFKAIYGITNYSLKGVIPIPDKFWPLVLTLLAIGVINFAAMWFWESVLSKLFHTVSNVIVYLITAAFFFILIMAEFDVLNSFNGFYYFLAFCGMVFAGALCSGAFWTIRRYRCANCHYFSGSKSGVTDHGNSVSTSDSWHDISNSSIDSSREVRNARELRRTWTTTHHWTDHICCDYCGNKWDMDESSVVNSETHALKRKWEEWS